MPESQSYLEVTQESGRAFVMRGIAGPVVMLNLLRFRDIADYSATPHLAPPDPISGETAYRLYIQHTLPYLRQSGGEMIFLGRGGAFLIGPADERWDAAMLIRQNSVADFIAFSANEAYLEGIGHRTAALEDSRLLPLVEEPLGVATKVDHSLSIKAACDAISAGNIATASRLLSSEYPFEPIEKTGRGRRLDAMTRVFFRDGFVDRYRGTRLVYPPVLRLLSSYVPEEFPFQEHWKMSETHIAYWELLPTIDHITPVARRGEDSETNAVCCSQLTNSAKSNWTLEELEWQLLPPGDLTQWDGMAGWFLRHVEAHPEVLKIRYVKQWYDALAGLKGDQRLCAKALEAVPELKHYFEKTF